MRDISIVKRGDYFSTITIEIDEEILLNSETIRDIWNNSEVGKDYQLTLSDIINMGLEKSDLQDPFNLINEIIPKEKRDFEKLFKQ
jgi:hypothetical protein